MRMPCDHDEYGPHEYFHYIGQYQYYETCPGGREATPADLVAELRRLDAIDYEAAAKMQALFDGNGVEPGDEVLPREWPASWVDDDYKDDLRHSARLVVDAALPEGETK